MTRIQYTIVSMEVSSRKQCNSNKMHLFFVYYFVIFLPYFYEVVNSSTVVVESPFGKIQGAKKTDDKTGVSYLSFQGIPYAKPPLGDLRFAKPQPHPHIDRVFDASKDVQTICPFPNGDGLGITDVNAFTEDCLILNIVIKDTGPSDSLKKVLVFIHGGGFIYMSSSHFVLKSFAISQDVITVTINYRLGILGFLSTENEASPGNYGLWDQRLAIKWVKDNIRAFGGDPNDITISGESAGGSSVGYQIISPHTKGLFTKAYQQSGGSTSVYARTLNAQSGALLFAKSVGCWENDVERKIDIEESKNLLDCLRKVPILDFIAYGDLMITTPKFVPRVDGDFLPDIPAKLLQDDAYLDSVGFFDRFYLVGIDNNEAMSFQTMFEMMKSSIFTNNETSVEAKELAWNAVETDIRNRYLVSRFGGNAASNENILTKVDEFYSSRFFEDMSLAQMVSDLEFLIPSLDLLSAISRRKFSSSYFLYFNYFPQYLKGSCRGSPHGLDIAYWCDIGGITIDFEKFYNCKIEGGMTDSDDDMLLRQMFSSIIGEFVKTGNPGLALKTILPSGWPKYDVTNSYYLNFNLKPWISSFLEKDKQDLWFETLPRVKKSNLHVHNEL